MNVSPRTVGVVAVVAIVAVLAVVIVRRHGGSTPPELSADSGFQPTSPDALAAPPKSAVSPQVAAADDAGMTLVEYRDFQTRIGNELCEQGAKRINVLEGLKETDPKGTFILTLCLRYGNTAWYRCILNAKTREEAGVCNKRFLRER
jgi:hypothetical protein